MGLPDDPRSLPWPDNVMAHDKDSIQVTYWRDWSHKHGVRFIDGFAPFFREPAETVMKKRRRSVAPGAAS